MMINYVTRGALSVQGNFEVINIPVEYKLVQILDGFMIAEVARQLKENNIKLPFTLYVANAVQEGIDYH